MVTNYNTAHKTSYKKVQSFDKAYKPFTISNPINWYSFKLTT